MRLPQSKTLIWILAGFETLQGILFLGNIWRGIANQDNYDSFYFLQLTILYNLLVSYTDFLCALLRFCPPDAIFCTLRLHGSNPSATQLSQMDRTGRVVFFFYSMGYFTTPSQACTGIPETLWLWMGGGRPPTPICWSRRRLFNCRIAAPRFPSALIQEIKELKEQCGPLLDAKYPCRLFMSFLWFNVIQQ